MEADRGTPEAGPQQPATATTTGQLDWRRRLLLILSISMLVVLMLRLGDPDTREDASYTPTPGTDPSLDPFITPRQRVWSAIETRIAKVAQGPLFPLEISEAEKFSGSWAAGAVPADLSGVSPEIAPNITVVYGVMPSVSGPSTSGLVGDTGTVQMILRSSPGFAAVPRVQKLRGVVKFSNTDGAGEGLRLQVNGVYLSDEGLLLGVATTEEKLGIVEFASLVGTPDSRQLVDTNDSSPADTASASPSPAAPIESSPSTSPAGPLAVPAGRCDVVLALRFRPVGFEGAAPSDTEAPAARRLSSADLHDVMPGAGPVALFGRAVSVNCNFSMNITSAAMVINRETVTSKALTYAFVAIGASILLVGFTTYQILAISSSGAFRISMASVGLQALMDAYLCLAHMVGALLSMTAFSAFATASFMNMVLFSIVQMRFLMVVWKARYPDAFAGSFENLRRALGTLYLRFYGALFFGLLLLYFGRGYTAEFITFLLMSFWVPQIIHSVQHDSRPGVTPTFVLGISTLRLFFPAYIYLCPWNILYALQPSETAAAAQAWAATLNTDSWLKTALPKSILQPPYPWAQSHDVAPALANPAVAQEYASSIRFGVVLVVWMLLQVITVLLQGKQGWGPRFFVPAVFLPRKYDYHRNVVIENGRVLPNPNETRAWMQSRTAAAAAANGAPQPGGANVTGAIQVAGSALLRRVRENIEYARDTAVWFVDCCRLLVIDWSARTRRWWKRVGRVQPLPGAQRGYTQLGRTSSSAGDEAQFGPGATAPSVAAAGNSGDLEDDSDPIRSYMNEVVTGDPEGEMLTATGELARMSSSASIGAAEPDAPAGARHSIDCVICMDAVTFPVRRKDFMVTPCDHVFHATCLTPWMEQKLECPTCRMQLPEP